MAGGTFVGLVCADFWWDPLLVLNAAVIRVLLDVLAEKYAGGRLRGVLRRLMRGNSGGCSFFNLRS